MEQTYIKWKGNKIPIDKTTLKKFGLSNGHEVYTEKEFYNILNGKYKDERAKSIPAK
jgi:hypothetical protein